MTHEEHTAMLEARYSLEKQMEMQSSFQVGDRVYCRWPTHGKYAFFENGCIVENPDVPNELGFRADWLYRQTYAIEDDGKTSSILNYCVSETHQIHLDRLDRMVARNDTNS